MDDTTSSQAEPEVSALRASVPCACRNCAGRGWVCEEHRDIPFESCACGGAGSPCGACNLELASAGYVEPYRHTIRLLTEALLQACGHIDSAEKDTNFVCGDPCGDSATVRLREIASLGSIVRQPAAHGKVIRDIEGFLAASAMSAGTAETPQEAQGQRPASATAESGDAQPHPGDLP